MSLQHSRSALVPSPSRSLCALLALLLLTPPGPLASAGPAGPALVARRELRCVCLSYTPLIHRRMITNVQVIAAGPQCPRVEVIATWKKPTQQACLNPEDPLVKKIIQKILDSSRNKKN